MNSKVDIFLEKASPWKEEMILLRKIVLECNLEEDYKWMHPCYTYHGKNVVLIHAFKEYCALLFHKGALLKDEEKLLIQQTENVQSARQLRFTDIEEIKALKDHIKAYIFEAIEVEKSGLQVKMKKTEAYKVPKELQQKFNNDVNFKNAFKALTPGRQRGYLLFFAQAKQSTTRVSRIEKYQQKILEGKGLNDR
ncbi:YdeI family protein [Zhouia sp. PK063]|uniref:YdeI family protein n=1 Tax=Zhouia sp. PK063 TaxID=3373602 RepID=UPI0037A9ED0B